MDILGNSIYIIISAVIALIITVIIRIKISVMREESKNLRAELHTRLQKYILANDTDILTEYFNALHKKILSLYSFDFTLDNKYVNHIRVVENKESSIEDKEKSLEFILEAQEIMIESTNKK